MHYYKNPMRSRERKNCNKMRWMNGEIISQKISKDWRSDATTYFFFNRYIDLGHRQIRTESVADCKHHPFLRFRSVVENWILRDFLVTGFSHTLGQNSFFKVAFGFLYPWPMWFQVVMLNFSNFFHSRESRNLENQKNFSRILEIRYNVLYHLYVLVVILSM